MRFPSERTTFSPGFTLIELLVVLVLMGLLGSIVFLSVSTGILSSREKRFVQDFRQTLNRARMVSLSSGQPAQFLIDSERRAYSLNGRKWQDIPETMQVEGEKIAEVSPGVFGVTFYPDGSSSGAELDLRWENGDTDRISVDRLLGLITTEHIGHGA